MGSVLLVSLGVALAEGGGDVRAIEQTALQSRRAITSYHLALRRVMRYKVAPFGDKKDYLERYEFWWDGDRVRLDFVPDDGKPTTGMEGMGNRTTYCQNCPTRGTNVAYTYVSSPVEVFPSDKMSQVAGPFDRVINIRGLGYSLAGLPLLEERGLESDVNSPTRKDVRAERADLNGEDAWLVRGTLIASGGDIRLWYLPGKAHNVGRIEATGRRDDGTPWEHSVASDLAQDPVSGVWFPRRCVYRVVIGGEVEKEETVDVLEAEINRGVDPAAFTLARMNIPRGSAMWYDRGKTRKYWDGEKPVDTDPIAPPPRPADPPAPPPARPVDPEAVGGGVRWWYAAAAGLFLAAAAVLLRRAAARRA